eukprot:6207195-Pleurochrysis_carterae.AAC.9
MPPIQTMQQFLLALSCMRLAFTQHPRERFETRTAVDQKNEIMKEVFAKRLLRVTKPGMTNEMRIARVVDNAFAIASDVARELQEYVRFNILQASALSESELQPTMRQ